MIFRPWYFFSHFASGVGGFWKVGKILLFLKPSLGGFNQKYFSTKVMRIPRTTLSFRDMSTVKCIKRSKDKNGEEKIEYVVLFDYVRYQLDYKNKSLFVFWTKYDIKKYFLKNLGITRMGSVRGDNYWFEGNFYDVWYRCWWYSYDRPGLLLTFL